MKVLSLDFGSVVGWCVTAHDRTCRAGQVALTGARGERFHRFHGWLGGMLMQVAEGGMVAYEEVRFNRGYSYIPGQTAITMVECERLGLPYVGVGVSELKKHATGNGNANKAAMIRAADGCVDHEPTQHEADAILVGRWVVDQVLGT